MKIFKQWGPSFKIEFDITVNEFPPNDETNILLFTKKTEGSVHIPGERLPAVWFSKKANGLHFTFSDITDDGTDRGHDFKTDIDHKYHIGKF